MRILLLLLLLPAVLSAAYFPPRGEWERASPDSLGFEPARLQGAIDFALANQSKAPRDLGAWLPNAYAREPDYRVLGPTRPRGEPTGVIIRGGRVAAIWGEPDRNDMTFSVAKSFVSAVAGLAWDRRLIRGLNDRVAPYVADPELFADPHNAPITWDHLLRQTSDWSGTLWDVPDWADRPVGATPADYPHRPKYAPGAHFKYNDVRVNLLALCLLHVWREPLPVVLRREILRKTPTRICGNPTDFPVEAGVDNGGGDKAKNADETGGIQLTRENTITEELQLGG